MKCLLNYLSSTVKTGEIDFMKANVALWTAASPQRETHMAQVLKKSIPDYYHKRGLFSVGAIHVPGLLSNISLNEYYVHPKIKEQLSRLNL